MHGIIHFFLAVTISGLANASPSGRLPSDPLVQPRQACVEGTNKICYGVNGGQSQGLDPFDLEYVAAYLRFIGTSNTGLNSFWTMPASSNCEEWAMPVPEGIPILVLAKHVSPFVKSSVLFQDIATTIDGGEGASAEARSAALLGCQENGGQMGVKVNATDPAYSSAEYRASGARSSGIIIKLVKMP